MSGKAVRETLGFLAVVAGLVFVGVEIQQNTAVARMSAYQSFTQQLIDQNNIVVAGDFPALNARMWRGEVRDEFAMEEILHIDIVYMNLLRTFESLYRSVQLGILDEDMLTIVDAQLGPFRFDYFQDAWPLYRGSFTEDFTTFFEARLVEG